MAIGKFDKRLGNILEKRGQVDSEILKEAVVTAEQQEKTLAAVLVDNKTITEADLLLTLAEETNLTPVNGLNILPDENVKQLLPENLANYYEVIPINKVGNILTIAVSNPFDILKLDDIERVTGCEIRPVLSTDFTIKKAIPEIYNKGGKIVQELLDNMSDPELELKEAGEDDVEDLQIGENAEGDAPVVKLVNLIIYQALKLKASDIHVEPQERKIRVRCRVDGVCREVLNPPKKMGNAISSRLKIMCGLDIAERRKPQDGKFQLRIDGRQIDFRVSTLPTVHGEKVVLRILDSANLALGLDNLGFEKQALSNIREAISKPYGMLLVTGPTGSGKSTTLYSAIREVMSLEDNIVTVEDPVEYQLDGVNQVQVNVKRGLTFATALRSILRQDPDTILLGEIRDQETVEIAVKAALTGHLVFSTLHTNDAPATITRMVDMGVDPFLVASSVQCVAAQRLSRRLCADCKKPMDKLPPMDRLLSLGFKEEDFKDEFHLYEAVGCSRCSGGYKGRFALLETLEMSEPLRRIVVEGSTAIHIKAFAMENQMISLRRCGVLNLMRGKTTVEEILRVTVGD